MSEGNDETEEQRSVMSVVNDNQFDFEGWRSGRNRRLYGEPAEPVPLSPLVLPPPGQHIDHTNKTDNESMVFFNSSSSTYVTAESFMDRDSLMPPLVQPPSRQHIDDANRTDTEDMLPFNSSSSTHETAEGLTDGHFLAESLLHSISDHSWISKEEDEDILDGGSDENDDDDDANYDGTRDLTSLDSCSQMTDYSVDNNEGTVSMINPFPNQSENEVFIPLEMQVPPQICHLSDRTEEQLKLKTYQLFNIESWKKIEDNAYNDFKVSVLIGFSDIFKKMHYQKFLLEYEEKFAGDIDGHIDLFILNSVADLDSCIQNPTNLKVVVLENAFGEYVFNDQDFSKLCKITAKLKFVKSLLALMLTSTSHCFHEGRSRFLDVIGADKHIELIVNIDDQENMSTFQEEKREALTSALDERKKQGFRKDVILSQTEMDVVCMVENPVFFDCCDLIEHHGRYCSDILSIFREPMPILVKYFSKLREASKKAYSVLVMCALKGELDHITSFQEGKPELSKYLDFDIKEVEFQEICLMFSDSILISKKDDNHEFRGKKFSFRLPMYRNAVLCVFFKEHPHYIIKNCPISFLTNVLPLIHDRLCGDVRLVEYEDLAKRYIKEIHAGNCTFLVSNKIWEEEKFMDSFGELNTTEKLYKTVTAEDNGVGFLAWSSLYGSDKLVSWILMKMKKIQKETGKRIELKYIVDAVMLSCIGGNLTILKSLYNHVWKKRENPFLEICKLSASHYDCMEQNYKQTNYPQPNYTRLPAYSTLWHTAIAYGHLEIVEFMLSKVEKKVNSTDSFMLSKERAIVNSIDSFMCSGLQIACRLQKEKVVRFLLDKGADLDKADKNRDTPLHEACASGNVEIAKMLLRSRPKMIGNMKGHNAMHKAVASKSVEMLRFLFEETEVVEGGGSIFLTYPEKSRYSLGASYQKLLQFENGAKDGETLLHKACLLEDNLNVIKYLMSHFPDLVHRKCSNGSTPLHIACKSLKNISTTIWLLDSGAKINAQNDELNTPLHLACENNQLNQVKYLTETKKAEYLKNIVDKFPHELTENEEIKKFLYTELLM